ncbi:MAG: hypothetical protein HXY27_02850 [Hydrogenophilaceae bacterium]|nr:hypothetical protein [Hydrogenophilaceae bacterium]
MAIQTNSRRVFHPAVSISSWLIFAVAVELASPRQLSWLALVAGFLLFQRSVWQRFFRLAWKAKWLLLAIMLLYALTMPGIYVWPGFQEVTHEGLQAGGLRVARLVILLAALARLLDQFSPRQLAGGLYLLAGPLERLGFDRRALAVRIALALEHIQQQPKGQGWLDELLSPLEVPYGFVEMRLVVPAPGLADAGLLAVSCIMLGATLL